MMKPELSFPVLEVKSGSEEMGDGSLMPPYVVEELLDCGRRRSARGSGRFGEKDIFGM